MSNTLCATQSPVSTTGHQSQLGHMTEWTMQTIYLSDAPHHICSALSWCKPWTLLCRPSLFEKAWKTKDGHTSRLCGSQGHWGIIHHLTTVVYLIYQVMWSLRKWMHYPLLESDCTWLYVGRIFTKLGNRCNKLTEPKTDISFPALQKMWRIWWKETIGQCTPSTQ